jgi:hypothetical protein
LFFLVSLFQNSAAKPKNRSPRKNRSLTKKRMNNPYDPYGCDEIEEHLIPRDAIAGRVPGAVRAALVGKIDLERGVIRIDAENSPDFWIEIKIGQVPAVAYAPGNPGAQAAAADFANRIP